MKKITIALLVALLVSMIAVAEEDDDTYWYGEYEIRGKLTTVYFFKTKKQFENCIKGIIKKEFGKYGELMIDSYKIYGNEWEKTSVEQIELFSSEILRKKLDNQYQYMMFKEYVFGIHMLNLFRKVGDNYYTCCPTLTFE